MPKCTERRRSATLLQSCSSSMVASSQQAAAPGPALHLSPGWSLFSRSSWGPSRPGERCAMPPRRNPAMNRLFSLQVSASPNAFGGFPVSGHRWGCICLLAPPGCSNFNGTYIFGVRNMHFFGIWLRPSFGMSQCELLIKCWLKRG